MSVKYRYDCSSIRFFQSNTRFIMSSNIDAERSLLARLWRYWSCWNSKIGRNPLWSFLTEKKSHPNHPIPRKERRSTQSFNATRIIETHFNLPMPRGPIKIPSNPAMPRRSDRHSLDTHWLVLPRPASNIKIPALGREHGTLKELLSIPSRSRT